MTTVTLQNIYSELEFLKMKVLSMEKNILAIKEEVEPEIRPEYLQKLEQIEKEKGKRFETKEKFLNFLENEL